MPALVSMVVSTAHTIRMQSLITYRDPAWHTNKEGTVQDNFILGTIALNCIVLDSICVPELLAFALLRLDCQ